MKYNESVLVQYEEGSSYLDRSSSCLRNGWLVVFSKNDEDEPRDRPRPRVLRGFDAVFGRGSEGEAEAGGSQEVRLIDGRDAGVPNKGPPL